MAKTKIQVLLSALCCALILFHEDVTADDIGGADENTIADRRLKHLRALRNLEDAPLNLFQQSQSEVATATASQLRGQHDSDNDQPPPSPTQPLNLFKQTRIVNGDEVLEENGAYPFQVQLGWGYCGGELIAPDVVLTAAHCIDGGSPSTVDIWDGTKMTRRLVQGGKMHPNYNNKKLHDDIAVMKLRDTALAVKEVSDGGRTYWELVGNDYDWEETPPIIRMQRYETPSRCTSLYSQGLADDITTMTVIGFGTMEGGNLSDKLREASVHYVTNSVCQQQYGAGSITDDMLCASDTVDEQDACQGDSGGPLFTRLPAGDYQLQTLVGLVSWGEGCALKEFPGVYSRVAANIDWVDEVVCGANGYSPKSCTADGKIRDFALDSLMANSRRRTQDVSSTIISRTLADELVKGVDYAGPATLKEEVCELLGGDADETPSPTSGPSASDSPSNAPIIPPSMVPSVSPSSRPSGAPIISPSMKPSVSPSLKPSTFPSGSPSKPPGQSPTKKFITNDKNANQKAKGIMYQLQAETGDVIIESISFKKRDDKDTNVQVYFRLGSYEDFPGQGLDPDDWGPPVFNGIPARNSNGLREAVLDDVLTIPKGEMASIYLSGKKEFMFQKGVQEFTVSDDAEDFKIFTGAAMKRLFQQRLMNADFFGGITYYTYIEGTKVTPTPSMSPSSSPSLTSSMSPSSSRRPSPPPNEDTSSPSVLPSNLPSLTPSEALSLSPSKVPSLSPSEDSGGGGRKVYTTPNANKAGAGTKGVMFSITAKSKEVSITGLGLMGTVVKASDLWIYYKNGSYDFDTMDEDDWNEVFDDKIVLDRNELVDVELAEDITIPAGGTVSLYVLSKKGVLYTKSSASEFDIYAASEDFSLRVGTTTKKEFQKPEKLAEFAGRITYQT